MGFTSLGIEYADPATRPCDIPDVLWRSFNRIAELVDGLEAAQKQLADPPMLRVAWLPEPGKPTQTVENLGAVRFNTVHLNNAGMYRPQVSTADILLPTVGFYLLQVQVRMAVPAGSNPGWSFDLQFPPDGQNSRSPVRGFDIGWDPGVDSPPTGPDQWLTAASVWRVGYGWAPYAVRLELMQETGTLVPIEIARADVTVQWLRDL